jgi:hypothetical protein
MNPLSRLRRDQHRNERTIDSLCARTGAPDAEVRVLFTQELARLAPRATVRSYLSLLAAANVRAALRRARPLLRVDVKRTVDSSVG